MSLKTSFFNKGLFFSNLKRFAWATALETIIIFLSLPLTLMMDDPSIDNGHYIDIFNEGWTIIPNVTLCVFPVVLAVLLFQYMHQPKMTTALHGLPVSRTQLFGSAVLSGVVLLALPIVFNTAMVGIVNVTMEVGKSIFMSSVLRWAAYALLLALSLFSFATFVGMFVGNAAGHFIFTYILHFLPLALFGIFMALCQMFLYGFDASVDIPQWMLELPMMTITHDFRDPCWYFMLLFACISVVFLALALVAYKKRPLEHAGDIVVFEWVKPVFKYGVSICLAAVGFFYIAGISNMEVKDAFVGNIFIAIVWAAIGFSIAQMLIMKTWRIFGAYKEMLAVCLVVAVIFIGFQTDLFGFERRRVAPEDVESVTVGYLNDMPVGTVTLKTPEAIELVAQLHEKALAERDPDYRKGLNYLHIEYRLKDGRTLKRAYHIQGCQQLLDLHNLEETKRAGFPMAYCDVMLIESIHFYSGGDDLYINDWNPLLEALRKDVDNLVIEPWWDAGADIIVPEKTAPAVTVEPSATNYHLEFRMYKSPEQFAKENKRINLYEPSRTYYYGISIRADEMPETYAVLDALMQQAKAAGM